MSKNYISSFIREIDTKYWPFLSVSLKKEELDKLPVDDYGSIKLNINRRKEVGKYKETHYCCEDTYRTESRKQV